jgi:cytokinin dehydrogenase
MNRREILKALGAGTLVIGFDRATGGWVTATAATEGDPFDGVPALDGVLLLDDASRGADATDTGNIVYRTPAAVLRPGSVADIAAMVRFCGRRRIKVSRRGEAHTTNGQSLSPGLVIEHGSLDRIHSITPSGAVVDAGVLWRELITAAYALGLTPPAITGYTKLSVGGTLSVGGVPGLAGSTSSGCQIDQVQALEVVTGTGDIVQCSLDTNRDLFEAMLGGLGQCGIITRVTLDLIPAKTRARAYQLHYLDNTTFFRDQRALLERSGLDQVFTQWFPPGTSKVYQLNAVAFYNPDRPPNDLALIGGLSGVPLIQDTPYLDYIFLVDNEVDTLRLTLNWDRLVKPWFDVWLPDSKIEQYVGDVVADLGLRDVGVGFVLIFPVKRSRITRPFFRVPDADGNGWIYLFDILTASPLPGPDPAFAAEMLARNARLYEKARAMGGIRYPIGSIDFTPADWATHYGDRWMDFQVRKHRFDPNGILSPGPGIFG